MLCDKCKINLGHQRMEKYGLPGLVWCRSCLEKQLWNMDDETYEGLQQLIAMTRTELDNVEYGLKKWICQCKGCTNGTRVRDYGVSPMFFEHRKRGEWKDLSNTFLFCGKHWKFYQRLLKSFDKQTIYNKLLDSTNPIDKLIELKFTRSNKINE